MKLAILHYHLNRGGVTRVIENQLRALDAVLSGAETWPVALIYGGRRQGWPEDLPERFRSIRLSLHEVAALDYDAARENEDPQPGTLDDQLIALLNALGFAPAETVVHVHNHALGKNLALPVAVGRLAEHGYAMLLQPHDFAEDFRPANFQKLSHCMPEQDPSSWHGRLYPQASHLHYALLNSRDLQILRQAGVDAGRLHLLPNPVPGVDQLASKEQARRRLAEQFHVGPSDLFVLYPVRGIRRKNVGEALLYSALGPPGTVIGLTLPPLNPAEQSIYTMWKQLAAELELPFRFELGAPGGLSFGENLAAADLVLTTSVAEGFGMVFLESWLALRGLIGRDLPEITADFVRIGVRLDCLQPQLKVPVEWVGIDVFRRTMLDAYRRTLSAYDWPEPPDIAERLKARTQQELLDFGDLDEPLQGQVIRIVCQSRQNRRRMLDCNPWIERTALALGAGADFLSSNVPVIHRHYSLVPVGRRLLDLYQRVASSLRFNRPRPLDDAERILDAFLDLKRFRPIRS